MPRLSVPLTTEQHRAIKVKAAETGLPQAEIARRFLLAWLAGETLADDEAEGKALALWKQWFEDSGYPWETTDWSGLDNFCFFCGERQPKHELDCVYIAARELLALPEEEAK